MNACYNPFSLKGKNILITGSSSGIGKITAVECSKLGAKLIITGRNDERLKHTLDQLSGENHEYYAGDLNDEGFRRNLIENCPVLDGIVFNAGIGINRPLNFIKTEDLKTVFETNLFSIMILNKLILKSKKLKKEGSIVFSSSLSAYNTAPGLGIYSSTKAALLAYMRTSALELASKKIRANAVLPGMIETELIKNSSYSDKDKQLDLQLYPLGRYGKPKDVALAIVFFLSDASIWITGSELIIDGGRSLK